MIFEDSMSDRELACLHEMKGADGPYTGMPGTARKLIDKGLAEEVAGGFRLTPIGEDVALHSAPRKPRT